MAEVEAKNPVLPKSCSTWN